MVTSCRLRRFNAPLAGGLYFLGFGGPKYSRKSWAIPVCGFLAHGLALADVDEARE